ncbi:hypothetical protein RWH43_17080 [Microbacterium sp. KSW2-21]|uniref:Asp23/Gls24 family envelope stress response protein n=1 Tax=Microbacterium algihabitans TaxID=3075992 RepID=A0ABU3S105_9MICO|nr:hypothetical protein [Microbacterium sp. KSW2-21]MDU0328475.1 hypothetical protein [Microbacterium sp. KSW2-21]
MTDERATPSADDLTAAVLSLPDVATIYPSTPLIGRLVATISTGLTDTTPDAAAVHVTAAEEPPAIAARIATRRTAGSPGTARAVADRLRSAHPNKNATISVQIASITP